MSRTLPRLYLITDRTLFPTQAGFLKKIDVLLAAGIKMLQIREKDLCAKDLFSLACRLREMTRAYECLLLINDRIDIAQACDADGVHLGENSLPTATARTLLGTDKIIGVSTHDEDALAKAAREGADFATFGPVFHTPSKAQYGPPKGLDSLAQACRKKDLPIYALGGIKTTHTLPVKAAGAYGIAAISALLTAENPHETCLGFKM